MSRQVIYGNTEKIISDKVGINESSKHMTLGPMHTSYSPWLVGGIATLLMTLDRGGKQRGPFFD